jgi:hypothetical protein
MSVITNITALIKKTALIVLLLLNGDDFLIVDLLDVLFKFLFFHWLSIQLTLTALLIHQSLTIENIVNGSMFMLGLSISLST